MTPAQRRRAAAEWAAIAQLEHASVASFARFTLQLMAVAAPPRLLTGALQAGLDEVEHARAAFRMASRFADAPLGPGPLPLHGVLSGAGDAAEGTRSTGPAAADDLALIAADAFAEGCVNETIGALEAQEAAAACGDDEARAVWSRIAEEEARHGELAWAFVRWALEQRGEPVRTALRRALARAEAAAAARRPDEPPDADAQALREVGLLSEAERHGIRRRGFAEVVRPAAATLGL